MKVLLLVPQSAATVGEEWVAYKLAEAITRNCDATVIALRRYSDKTTIASLLPAARVFECEAWPTHKVHERLNALVKPNYVKFYGFARRKIAELLKQEHFDVAHQIGPVGMRYPSPLRRFDIPFVIGPVGGTQPTPSALRDDDEAFPWYYRLRNFDAARFAFDPWLRSTYERAAAVVGIAPYVGEVLSGLKLQRLEFQSESAIESLPAVERQTISGRLRLLYVGRAIRTKGLLYIVQAMARLADVPGLHLDAVGGGPDLENCKNAARALGVMDRITFHGQISHAQLDGLFRSHDLLLNPTFREAGGVVLFEAMGYGLPVICSNYGAPGHFVKDSFGIRVPVTSREALVAGIADGIRALSADPSRLARMSAAAREEVADKHLWSSRGRFFLDLYRSIASRDALSQAA